MPTEQDLIKQGYELYIVTNDSTNVLHKLLHAVDTNLFAIDFLEHTEAKIPNAITQELVSMYIPYIPTWMMDIARVMAYQSDPKSLTWQSGVDAMREGLNGNRDAVLAFLGIAELQKKSDKTASFFVDGVQLATHWFKPPRKSIHFIDLNKVMKDPANKTDDQNCTVLVHPSTLDALECK